MSKNYVGNCVNPPYDIGFLVEITENAKEIKKQDFKNACYIPEEMNEMINDNIVSFSFYRGIYFFTHSAIEYFFE